MIDNRLDECCFNCGNCKQFDSNGFVVCFELGNLINKDNCPKFVWDIEAIIFTDFALANE